MGKPGKSRVKFRRDVPRASGLSVGGAGASSSKKTTQKPAKEEEEEQPGINFVPCAVWVPRGVCKAVPDKIELTKEELKRVINETKKKLQDLEEEEEEGGEGNGNVSEMEEGGDNVDVNDIEAKYGFDDYDDEEESGDLGLGQIAEFGDNAEDPLYKEPEEESDSDSEKEDFELKPSDNLIVVGHWEEDCSVLEVHVYNSEENSLFVHHDILLPACPLALEWIDCFDSEQKGNFVAVGSMNPVIEVWDLDVVNCLEPCLRLGGKAKKKKHQPGFGHKDAVLDLAWNRISRTTLASASVDKTAILWDYATAKPSKTLRNFEEKVQSIWWHQSEANVLITGCGDGKVRIFDTREEGKPVSVWKFKGSVEKVVWDPFKPNVFYAGTENGFIDCCDTRQKQPLWDFQAVTESLADIAVSPSCPGCLISGSEDGQVQIWDSHSGTPPSLVARHDMGVGKIMFLRFCPDEPFAICAGGDFKANTFTVYDIRNTSGVVERFQNRVPGSDQNVEPMDDDS